ncbi:MAG: hypothetical protein IPN94_02200 [Sphingobacteriales bacterium]|nr:hypothetical protein [Sphingobacteriales bacterium]
MDKLIVEVAGDPKPTIPQIQEHLANGWSIHQLNTHLNDKGTVVVVVCCARRLIISQAYPSTRAFKDSGSYIATQGSRLAV